MIDYTFKNVIENLDEDRWYTKQEIAQIMGLKKSTKKLDKVIEQLTIAGLLNTNPAGKNTKHPKRLVYQVDKITKLDYNEDVKKFNYLYYNHIKLLIAKFNNKYAETIDYLPRVDRFLFTVTKFETYDFSPNERLLIVEAPGCVDYLPNLSSDVEANIRIKKFISDNKIIVKDLRIEDDRFPYLIPNIREFIKIMNNNDKISWDSSPVFHIKIQTKNKKENK
ncbi:MAG: hypothetical protein ACOCQD_01085 [archaeon]